MADETNISWADSTFNPWIGCEKVSPACAHCYAETLTGRMGVEWGEHGERRPAAESTWRKPHAWNRAAEKAGRRRRVFCASLADVFEPRLELDALRWRLFETIEQTPWLDWLILTKRPDYAKAFLLDGRRATPDEVDNGCEFGIVPPFYYDCKETLPNVWLGVSIENSRQTWRADVLRQIPAALRFISAEPLLGSLFDTGRRGAPLNLDGFGWVIAGGESGSRRARPPHPDWMREIRDACAERSIPFHMKQWGSYAPSQERSDAVVAVDPNGSRRPVSEAFPGLYTAFLEYRGASPKSGGKLLDGSDHCAIPSTPHDFTLA